MRIVIVLVCLSAASVVGCAPVDGSRVRTKPEVVSLLDRPLYAAPPGDRGKLKQAFFKSIVDLHASPGDLSKIVWPGRRLGYLWRMHDAIDYYTVALERYPNDAPLYRHRGHRYISIREFDKAIADLEKAAALLANEPDEIEPDGMPNAKNIPLTTTKFNVWYHLALARYLKGDFEGALEGYREAMKYSRRYDDNLAATTHWMYMTLRRSGRTAEAAALLEPIYEDMEIIENHAYHRCLLMYKGLVKPESLRGDGDASGVADVTQGYGLGNWYLYNGERAKAKRVFERVVSSGMWPGFGFIAAEADLARLRE